MSNESMNFDLTVAEIPVTIGGRSYILREADGEATVKYENARLRYTEVQGDRVVAVDGMSNTQPLLVSLCLFDAETGKPVPEDTIRKWPGRVQKSLFERAKEISQIDQPSDLKALKESRDKIERRIKELEGDSLGN